MSRWILFVIAAVSVLIANTADQGSSRLGEQQHAGRGQAADDNIVTGSASRRPASR
ncbi:hypothetical protein [Phreatobacter sp.]|uniref:hypothetical protein n=1 Tax=Phreatobacter sp. TaxID=1966341 RepID=UPI003F6FB6F1